MPIFEIFSRRQKELNGEFPDVYQYSKLPREFRVQLVHVLTDLLGDPESYQSLTMESFKSIHDILCREYGEFMLSKKHHLNGDFRSIVFEFLLETPSVDRVFDVIELALKVAEELAGNWQFEHYSTPKMTAEEAILEINRRFRDHGIGFQLENGEIIRIDSQLLHQEVVRPALYLLSGKEYAGPSAEFLQAHEHYRHGRMKEAIVEAAKSLESTLKIIADRRGWKISGAPTAKNLLDAAFREDLIPSHLQSEFTALRSTLESGVPTVRNKLAGHGQGATLTTVPEYLVAYILHLTASSIILVVEADAADVVNLATAPS